MQRCVLLLSLLVILAACGPVALPTPQPTASIIPTPGAMVAQSYLPLMAKNYPTPFRGVAGGLWGMDAPYYHWSISPMTMDARFSRMVWCLSDYHLALFEPQVILAAQRDYAAGIRGRVWLIMNEPDDNSHTLTNVDAQCGAYPLTGNPFDFSNTSTRVWQSPADVAVRYSRMYDLIKRDDPYARVFVGGLGWIGYPNSRDWWSQFVGELERRGELWKIDGVHIHAYPFGSFPEWGLDGMYAGLQTWYTGYHVGLGLGNRPIWITETGGGACSRWERWDAAAWTTIRDETMLPMIDWFNGLQNPGYDGVFWFVSWDGTAASWWCNYLSDNRTSPTQITPLGVTWLTK